VPGEKMKQFADFKNRKAEIANHPITKTVTGDQ
jgi:hypothetical protein